jgi:hypothetical protein
VAAEPDLSRAVTGVYPEERAMPDNHKDKMKPRADSPPGLETDGKGNVIPLAQRTKEDQEKAAAGSLKNPEGEAKNPSAMPREQQSKGGSSHHGDPAGQQGGTHR